MSELQVPHAQCFTGIFSSFTRILPSFPRFQCTANKSGATFIPRPQALTECCPVDFRRSSIVRRIIAYNAVGLVPSSTSPCFPVPRSTLLLLLLLFFFFFFFSSSSSFFCLFFFFFFSSSFFFFFFPLLFFFFFFFLSSSFFFFFFFFFPLLFFFFFFWL